MVAACGLDAATGLSAPVLVAGEVRPLPRRVPRLFALDLADEAGAASAVYATVEGALAEAMLFEPETRPFWPHITLARARGSRREGRGRCLSGRIAPLELAPPPVARVALPAVTLYRSHLSPRGAHYEPLARRELEAR